MAFITNSSTMLLGLADSYSPLHSKLFDYTDKVSDNVSHYGALGAAALALVAASVVVFRRYPVDSKGNQVPPGPRLRYAFLRKYPERALHAWAQKYGPLFSVQMGSQLAVVISAPDIARDLLVMHGAIFSSRKPYFMKNQTILKGRAITASEYDDTWRKHRRLAMSLLTPNALKGYESVIDYEAEILISSLWKDTCGGTLPINPAHYAGRYALNNMLTVSFGMRTDAVEDPLVERALDLAMEFMDLTGPWSNPIDFIEILQYIPTKMRSRGRKLHDDLIEVYGGMIERVEKRLESGEIVPDCLVKTLIENKEAENLDQEDLCMLSAVFTLGGVHSTSGLIQWFMAVMPKFPEIQKLAHEELDRVVGQDRMPTAADEKNLPYLRSIIKELQRVHTPFWMATPHYSTEDFVYRGMYIPKNTLVVLNCFTLHHNPDRYENPYEFDPTRYAGDNLTCLDSSKLSDPWARDHFAFGAGRRFCPGIAVAERELWMSISRLIWTFKFSELPGEPISLEEYEGLSGRTPVPYRVQMTPRNPQVVDTLQHIIS